jgi:hypothetical protein
MSITTSLFNNLPAHSRVWIYQSNQRIDDATVVEINKGVKAFAQSWTAHTQKVTADGAVLFNHFIVLAADEQQVQVSGCSIDSSVKFIQQIQEKYNLHFFDRLYTTYYHNNEVKGADKDTLQQLLDAGIIDANTLVFNNLIQNVEQLQTKWLIPLKDSWHKRVFNFTSVIA